MLDFAIFLGIVIIGIIFIFVLWDIFIRQRQKIQKLRKEKKEALFLKGRVTVRKITHIPDYNYFLVKFEGFPKPTLIKSIPKEFTEGKVYKIKIECRSAEIVSLELEKIANHGSGVTYPYYEKII